MNTKKTLIVAAVIGILLLSGCVATPYYGSVGYYRGATYGYGYQPSIYYSTPGYMSGHRHYMSGPRHYIGGHIHLNGGHKHHIGGHRHFGGHKHFGGGHRGRGHGRHH